MRTPILGSGVVCVWMGLGERLKPFVSLPRNQLVTLSRYVLASVTILTDGLGQVSSIAIL